MNRPILIGCGVLAAISSARADEHFPDGETGERPGIVCASQNDVAGFLTVLSASPNLSPPSYVFAAAHGKGYRCVAVRAVMTYKGVVESINLGAYSYDIVRIQIQGKDYFSFMKAKGTNA